MENKQIVTTHGNGQPLEAYRNSSDSENMKAHEEDKLSDTKCPMCGKYMKVTDDNEMEKVFGCDNCSGSWKYNKKDKRMYRTRG